MGRLDYSLLRAAVVLMGVAYEIAIAEVTDLVAPTWLRERRRGLGKQSNM